MRHVLHCMAMCACLASFGAKAEDACRPAPALVAAQPDGGTLTVATECPAPDTRRFVLQLSCADGTRCDRVQLEQAVMLAPGGHAALRDVDGDGLPEVELRGACDAGPNCRGDIYKASADGRTLQHLFSGRYADLQAIDGWLVRDWRVNCCAWDFDLWKLDRGHPLPLQRRDRDLLVQLEAIVDSEAGEPNVRCTFLQPDGDQLASVDPPSPSLLRICDHFDVPYLLAPAGSRQDAPPESDSEDLDPEDG